MKGVIALRGGEAAAPLLGRFAAPSLAPVGNRPLLFHTLDRLHDAGMRDVAIVAPEMMAGSVRDLLGDGGAFGLRLQHVTCGDVGGPARALLAAEDFVDGERFVLHSSEELLEPTLPPLRGLLDAERPDTVLLVHRDGAPAGSPPETRRLLRLAGVAVNGAKLEVTGVMLFGPGALRQAAGALHRGEPTAGICDLVEELSRAGGQVRVHLVRDWHRFTGSGDELLQLNRVVLDRLQADYDEHLTEDNRIQGRVVVHPSAHLERTIIRGPAIIGANAILRDCYVGPYTAVGARVCIDDAEIEHSLIMEDAQIRNIGSRLEGSVVGSGACVYRDFSLPRAFRLQVGDGAEVALA